MTRLKSDIYAQPEALQAILDRFGYEQGGGFANAARLLAAAKQIYILGMGASWNAGMAMQAIFQASGVPALPADASEFLYFAKPVTGSVWVVLSRSGASVEIVKLIAKARQFEALLITISNTNHNPLAEAADVALSLSVSFDHLVSIKTYSSLALAAGLLATAALNQLDVRLYDELSQGLRSLPKSIEKWSAQISGHEWTKAEGPSYFLARGASMASAFSGKLLWEEAAKTSATAMPSGAFRHGSQEVIRRGFQVALILDQHEMRAEDLAAAADIQELGGNVLLIGQRLPPVRSALTLELPACPAGWQFVFDAIPLQLAAEAYSRAKNVDCDAFRICAYLVESEHGLIPRRTEDKLQPVGS